MKNRNWKKYTFEFLSIFIAVIAAFALDNWNDNRRDRNTEVKILKEIENGLIKDIEDIQLNMGGHKEGLQACSYWRNVANDRAVNLDSLGIYYLSLTRDFISIQNVSGYESLKSKGLEIIKDDSLRYEIISLYEYDFNILRKFEEEYQEMQFHKSFYKEINTLIAPNLVFDSLGRLGGIDLPLNLSESDKKIFLANLWKIEVNRRFILYYYSGVEKKIVEINKRIEQRIGR